MIQKEEYRKMFEVEDDHWWYKGLREHLFYWIGKFKPEKILDAGCGTGVNASLLSKKGYEIYGLDFSGDSLEYCKKRGLTNLKQGIIQQLPYDDKEFDAIYCMDVIGCLPEDEAEKAIAEAYRCLRSGGVYYINAAALNWLFSAQDVTWHIKKRYTVKDLSEMLEKHNFKIIKKTYRIFLLFPLVLISKLLSKVKILLNPNGDIQSDTDKTNKFLNTIFNPIMKAEFLISKYINLPIGSSVFIVAQKP